ncbi:carboxymuconolactone decarboxylase family protein [Mycobacterium xenopi 3993]|nr:carboxymuconolactone decarboxylase family protein [Mycobacterium xenopi 3993]
MELGRRQFAEVMTFPPPDDSSPTASGLIDYVFAEVWSRPLLSRRDRRFVTLPCVAAADAQEPLEQHVYAALNSGDVTITEMREIVLHFAVYAGWPKASRFNMAVDEQWDRIHRERSLPVTPPEPLLPLVTPSDPESRLAGGEKSFKDINCIPFAPPRDNPYSGPASSTSSSGNVAAPGTGHERAAIDHRRLRGFSRCTDPDHVSRLRRAEEQGRLVRRNGRGGIAFRRLLRLAQSFPPQPGDR